MRLVNTLLFLALNATVGCATFVEVDTAGARPVFKWRADAPVTGLTVYADEDCEVLPGKTLSDRIWWQLAGKLQSPVTYGKVPKGAKELAAARALIPACRPYTVVITDPNMQGEKASFRP